jgi:hypothetical protein
VLTVGAFAHWSTVAYLYAVAGFSSGFGAVDIVAMVFGMRRALFPVLATSVYNAGPVGLGLLSSAMGVGAMVASLTAGWVGRAPRVGLSCSPWRCGDLPRSDSGWRRRSG